VCEFRCTERNQSSFSCGVHCNFIAMSFLPSGVWASFRSSQSVLFCARCNNYCQGPKFVSRATETCVGVHQTLTHAKNYVSACDKPRIHPHLDTKCLQTGKVWRVGGGFVVPYLCGLVWWASSGSYRLSNATAMYVPEELNRYSD